MEIEQVASSSVRSLAFPLCQAIWNGNNEHGMQAMT